MGEHLAKVHKEKVEAMMSKIGESLKGRVTKEMEETDKFFRELKEKDEELRKEEKDIKLHEVPIYAPQSPLSFAAAKLNPLTTLHIGNLRASGGTDDGEEIAIKPGFQWGDRGYGGKEDEEKERADWKKSKEEYKKEEGEKEKMEKTKVEWDENDKKDPDAKRRLKAKWEASEGNRAQNPNMDGKVFYKKG